MNEEELREGLAKAMYYVDVSGLNDYDSWEELREDAREYGREMADAAIAYLRQHDGHAEFVRAVREIAERAVIRHGDGLGEASGTIAIIAALCEAELAKETSNGN